MTREELLKSNEYWMINYQNDLFRAVNDHFEKTKLTPTEMADKFGITIKHLNEIMIGNFNGNLKLWVKIMIICGYAPYSIPQIKLTVMKEFIELDKQKVINSAKNIKNFL